MAGVKDESYLNDDNVFYSVEMHLSTKYCRTLKLFRTYSVKTQRFMAKCGRSV